MFFFYDKSNTFTKTLYKNTNIMNKDERQIILDKYGLKLTKEKNNGSINVKGIINIGAGDTPRTDIPDDLRSLFINKLKGSFACEYNNFTSIDGAPRKITGVMWCHETTFKFTTLTYFPEVKGGIIDGSDTGTFSRKFNRNLSEKHPSLEAFERIVSLNNIINS